LNELNRPYKWLAKYYDQLFTFHLPRFKAARQRVLADILPCVESACDLACGTGTTALLLAGQGIKMFGVDLSPVMCRLARQKAHRARLPLSILRADMRDFRLPEQVGLVLCEFDALNHVPRKTDLRRVAHAVSRALRPGGYFFFDVNNRRAFEKIWPGSSWVEQPGVVLLMRGGYDRERDRGGLNLEWFLREGKLWRRHHEHVEQVAWTSTEIRSALQGAGFDQVRAWDARLFSRMPNISPGCRTFYLARKASLSKDTSL